ncbi:cytochrome c3 family protein [Chloroflexota bacterium]
MRRSLLVLGAAVVALILMLAYTPNKADALDENQCLACHGDPTLGKVTEDGRRVPLYVVEETLNISAHRFIDCTTCHTSKPHEVATPLTKQSLAEKCGSCHQYQYKLHLESIHGEQLAQGNPDVATCVDCHSPTGNPHSVIRVLEYDAPTYKKNVAETCAQCHGNGELMEKYGILEKVYETYMRSFHGKAIQLGSYDLRKLNKATCVSCHGSHDIKNVSAPQSPVVGVENLARTCESCHPEAGVELASGFLGHKEVSPQYSSIVFYIEKFFVLLTSSVIALGGFVVSVAGIRWGISRWRK